MSIQKVVLASQSPRRRQLLEWAEINFDIIVQSTAETFPDAMPVEEVPVHIAQQKAQAVLQCPAYLDNHKGTTIIAADTVVVLKNTIIGKPVDRDDAISILEALSGKEHQVITGVVITDGNRQETFADITKVWFHPVAKDDIVFYVDKYQPFDKAGAYAIQEWIGVVGIKSIVGDFYNVMGLPVSRVVQALHRW